MARVVNSLGFFTKGKSAISVRKKLIPFAFAVETDSESTGCKTNMPCFCSNPESDNSRSRRNVNIFCSSNEPRADHIIFSETTKSLLRHLTFAKV